MTIENIMASPFQITILNQFATKKRAQEGPPEVKCKRCEERKQESQVTVFHDIHNTAKLTGKQRNGHGCISASQSIDTGPEHHIKGISLWHNVKAAKVGAFIFILLRFVKGEIERRPMMQGVLRRTSWSVMLRYVPAQAGEASTYKMVVNLH